MKTCNVCLGDKVLADFYPRMARCKKCHTQKVMANHRANPVRVKAARDRWRSKPGSKEKECIASRRWQKEHPEQVKLNALRYNLKKLYGMSVETYQELVCSQNGLCAICSKASNRQLDVDHNHTTGQIRELLCSNCNTLLGHCKEDISILEKSIDYLNKHNNPIS